MMRAAGPTGRRLVCTQAIGVRFPGGPLALIAKRKSCSFSNKEIGLKLGVSQILVKNPELLLVAEMAYFPLDHQPGIFSGPPGNRTPIAWVQTKRLPVGPAARIIKRSVPELNRVFLLTEEVCCRNTYRPFSKSDPGWSRTIHFPGCHPGVFAVGPRDHFTVTEVGVEPTGTRLSTSPLCQFAYPVSGGSGGCARRSRLMGPAEHWPTRSCRPRYRTGHTGLMGASWAPAAPAISDQGESRTPMPCGTTF